MISGGNGAETAPIDGTPGSGRSAFRSAGRLPAFFIAALLASSIAAASHSSPPAATSTAAPPSWCAHVPQRSLLPATPSAPTHSRAASASYCCSALVPLLIASAAPICCLQPHPAGHPSHLPLQPLQPTIGTSFPQQPPLPPAALVRCSTRAQPPIPCSNNRSRYPSSTLAATSRCHLLPSSIVAAAASSSSLPLPPVRPQQHIASIDVAASPTAFPTFCPLFHTALFLPLLSAVIFQPPSPATIAALSLGRIIILPKGGLPPATSVPPLLICRRPAFGSALPLPLLPPAGRRYPSPACCRSAPAPLPQPPPYCAVAASPTSLALNRAFLPLHLHHRRCQLSDPALPNLFPATAAIAGHNRCPSPIYSSASSVVIIVSSHCCHLSPVTAASCLATATTPCYRLLPSAPSPTPSTPIYI
ncbi:hypothetical protein BHM03_00045362 [Ensete ventricosum]|nr:hypothetical protein BHM03_00045362 [Ensete ventricosum]